MKWYSVVLLILSTFLAGLVLGYLTPLNSSKDVASTGITTTEITDSKTTPDTKDKFSVPILMYHYIRDGVPASDTLGLSLSVTPTTFEKQMAILKAAGYTTISLTELANREVASKSIVITFDDGYKDQYDNAFPVLQKYGFKATFFIIGDFVGHDGYMGEYELTRMKNSGMEIGGHSMSHPNLATASSANIQKEIYNSIKTRDKVFAYPSGQYSDLTLSIAVQLKVVAAVTTKEGIATENCNVLTFPRVRVKEATDILKNISEELTLNRECIYLSPTPTPKPTITPTPTAGSSPSPTPSPTVKPTQSATP